MNNSPKKPRILVVEDEMVVARDISEQLIALGYEPVAQAQSGEEALLLAGQLRPDLVLMDIQLAGAMDGISAAQSLRNQWSVPVVFLTAFDADETLERAKLVQPYGYLLKPFSERDLRSTLEVALYKCQAEARLQDMAQRTQAILDNMQDAVLSVNAQGDIESSNQAASRIFGYPAQQILQLNLRQLVPDQQLELRQADDPPRAVDGVRQDGSTFPLVLTVSRLPQAREPSFMVLAHDLSSQHKDAQEIHRLAFYDRLTGLANRDWFKEHIGQAAAHSKRTGAHAALLLLDLDDFKKINDTHGLQTGDSLLIQAGQRMKTALRAADAVARLGGDEFAVLMQDLSLDPDLAAAQAQTKAQALIALLAQSFQVGAQACQTTASAGVVLFLGAQQDADDLLKKADIALYQAKSSGRNAVRFFDAAMQTRVLSHAQRLDDLGRGLSHNEFLLYYQPQVNRDGIMTGAEALVRWQHPTRGMVPPGEFIALAEESKLILPLGQWVLENACAQVRAWANDPRTAACSVAINVSALQFAQANFVANVEFALRTTGANPKFIKLELTESMLVSDVPGVIAKMNQIRALGVSFSLDDFGTGYSSLSYLKRLPLDQLKIDQSFVRDLLTDPNDSAIAHAVIALGHSLGLQVIAEGVETAEQRGLLADMNCDAFQGYLFSRPVPAAALPDFGHKSAC